MRAALSILFLLVTCVAVSGADTVTLKDGSVIEGAVQSYEKGKFLINDGGRSPKTLRPSDIESINFGAGGAAVAPQPPKPKQAKVVPPRPQKPVVNMMLEGTDLDAWKLARQTVSRSGDWQPFNPLPSKAAVQSSAIGDYAIRIPVIEVLKGADIGVLTPNRGFFVVYISTIAGQLRVERHDFVMAN